MELVVKPHHPVASDVGSSPSTHIMESPFATHEDGIDYNDDPAGCTAHDNHDGTCARCLIAAGYADDVTRRYITPTGRLLDGAT